MKTQNVWPKFGQKVRAKLPSFTALRRAFTLSWITTAPKPKQSPRSNLYQDCNECPLDVFIDCLINHKLERLIKSGEASQKELSEAWEKLFIEYCDLSGDKNMKHLIHLSKNIGYLQCRILAAQLCVYVLSNRKSDACVEQLKLMGFNGNFNEASIADDLKSVIATVKSFEIDLQRKALEYEKIVNEGGKAKLESSYFDNMLVDLSKFMGFRLKKNELTVNEFMSIKSKYQKEMELLQNNPPKKISESKHY
jgi:hypothetical protein